LTLRKSCLIPDVYRPPQFISSRCDDRPPLALVLLPEQTHGRVPDTILAIFHPAPIRVLLQQGPNGLTERTAQVGGHSVDSDDEVE
jgi:hypothetical protein